MDNPFENLELFLRMSERTTDDFKNERKPTSTPQEYYKLRLAQIDSMKAKAAQGKGPEPYPHKFHVSISLGDFIEKYKDIKDGEHHSDVVSVAGQCCWWWG